MNRNPESLLKKLESKHSESIAPVEDTMDNAEQEDTKKDRTPVTPEEFVDTLAHSDKFNIVVEGSTDHDIYDQLTAELGKQWIDYYIAGCRDEVFKVYDLIKKDPKKCVLLNSRVAFIADQDDWVFLEEHEKPPNRYNYICFDEIIWTDGYTVENDLYVKGDLKRYVRREDLKAYEATLNSICRLYAFERLGNQLKPDRKVFNINLHEMVPEENNKDNEISKHLRSRLAEQGFTCESENLEKLEEESQKIKQNYEILINGKTLFQLILRFLKLRGLKGISQKNKDWQKMLAVIATTESTLLVEDLRKKIIDKLSGLKERQTSTIDELMKEKPIDADQATFSPSESTCPHCFSLFLSPSKIFLLGDNEES